MEESTRKQLETRMKPRRPAKSVEIELSRQVIDRLCGRQDALSAVIDQRPTEVACLLFGAATFDALLPEHGKTRFR